MTTVLMNVQWAFAQQAPDNDSAAQAPLELRSTPALPETLSKQSRGALPSLVNGDRITGRPDLDVVVEGNATLRKGDTFIRADRIEYNQPDDQARASGSVYINQAGNTYEGPELQLKLETFEGFFNKVSYRFLKSEGHGQADRIEFLDQNRTVAYGVTYTTCQREDVPGWVPAWMLRAASIRTDSEENTGIATDAKLSFMGISTPALPSLSFPLTGERKSGLLPPVFGMSSISGIEISQPYYWNIAPNRDATFTPTLMSKRGVNLSTEFRYLENGYRGDIRADYMPNDTLRSRDRWGLWTHHDQSFDGKSLGLDSLSASLRLNRVSDNDYWRDFTRSLALSSRLLANEGALNWTKGDWNGQARALKYQTLQDVTSPITPPYDRVPQITANYNKYDWNGFDFSLNLDYTGFRADRTVYQQPNADRVFGLATLSRPFLTPGTFLIPKLQLHATSYQFSDPLSNGATSASRTVPTFSLDGGMIFERDANFFGRALRQTLEPRAFYVYTPYRDQSMLPVYDTAQNDFNFASIYTENAYSGNDRISDTQTTTLGVTSRLIDHQTGAEVARVGVAQRLRMKNQRVTLPGQALVDDRFSDVLIGGAINWTPRWGIDGTVQYNPDARTSKRSTLNLRYSPGPYRTINAAYRYQADTTPTSADGNKSIDVGWQWPLNDLWGDKGKDLGAGRGQGGGRWYAVGRLNYSLYDKKLADGVVGLEYDGCCWIGRVVLERLTTGRVTAETRIMFQLELVGFSSFGVGINPLRALRQNIQGYQSLRMTTPGPSRFTNYD